jgi:hypothetical protein
MFSFFKISNVFLMAMMSRKNVIKFWGVAFIFWAVVAPEVWGVTQKVDFLRQLTAIALSY